MNGVILVAQSSVGRESVRRLVSKKTSDLDLVAQILPESTTIPSPDQLPESFAEPTLLVAFWPLTKEAESLLRTERRRPIPRLVIIDHVMEFSAMCRIPADKIACMGIVQARLLRRFGNNCHVVGIPGFDSPLLVKAPSAVSSRPGTIVVWNSNHESEESRSVLEWSRAAPLERNYTVEVIQDDQPDILGRIASANACITTDVNRLFLSMVQRVPTALVRYSTSASPIEAAWRISSPALIGSTAERILDPEPARLLFQDTAMHLACDSGDSAISRLRSIMEQMLEADYLERSSREAPLPTTGSMEREERFRHEEMFSYPTWLSGEEEELMELRGRYIRFARPYNSRTFLPGEIHASFSTPHRNIHLCPAQPFRLKVSIDNGSAVPFRSFGRAPVYASYHWVDGMGVMAVHEGVRTPIDVPAGCLREVEVRGFAPPDAGIYELIITLVQEGSFWFDERIPNARCSCWVMVA